MNPTTSHHFLWHPVCTPTAASYLHSAPYSPLITQESESSKIQIRFYDYPASNPSWTSEYNQNTFQTPVTVHKTLNYLYPHGLFVPSLQILQLLWSPGFWPLKYFLTLLTSKSPFLESSSHSRHFRVIQVSAYMFPPQRRIFWNANLPLGSAILSAYSFKCSLGYSSYITFTYLLNICLFILDCKLHEHRDLVVSPLNS